MRRRVSEWIGTRTCSRAPSSFNTIWFFLRLLVWLWMSSFPISRIKKVMKEDSSVNNIASESVIAVCFVFLIIVIRILFIGLSAPCSRILIFSSPLLHNSLLKSLFVSRLQMGLATERFLELLASAAYDHTKNDGRKTVTYKDLAQAVKGIDQFEFLDQVIPMQAFLSSPCF